MIKKKKSVRPSKKIPKVTNIIKEMPKDLEPLPPPIPKPPENIKKKAFSEDFMDVACVACMCGGFTALGMAIHSMVSP